MTGLKVIDILERIVEEDWHVYTDDAIEALQIAKETMEKEIPKKPVEGERTYKKRIAGEIEEVVKIVYRCPNGSCNRLIDDLTYNYCPWCGQKFDWEEDDGTIRSCTIL